MEKIHFVGLDIAKNIFQVFMANANGKQIANKKIKRTDMKKFFVNLPPCTIGIEACGSANYWARVLQDHGHQVRIIQPIRVKAFRGNHNKTDAADARAICEALIHPGTRFVAPKTESQQDLDHIISLRERLVRNRTQLVNQVRSYMYEHGIVIPHGRTKFKNEIPKILSAHWDEFGDKFQIVITESMSEFEELNSKIDRLDAMIKKWSTEDEKSKILMTIPGIGPLTAAAILSHIGDANKFKNGRQLAAYFGITPKEYSSGGKQKLLGITKHGCKRIRTLLIIAARAIITGLVRRKRDIDGNIVIRSNFEKWILNLQIKIGLFKAAVAMANKLARIAWAMMTKNEVFNPDKASLCLEKG